MCRRRQPASAAPPAWRAAARRPSSRLPGRRAAAPPPEFRYPLDSGDKLRIVVFGQEGLTNTYAVDADGNISMPLIGAVAARGLSKGELSRRDRRPAEIEELHPRALCGDRDRDLPAVLHPGRGHRCPANMPMCANMTVETAIAIAGGYDAARLQAVRSRSAAMSTAMLVRFTAPLAEFVRPGDTITVEERWF